MTETQTETAPFRLDPSPVDVLDVRFLDALVALITFPIPLFPLTSEKNTTLHPFMWILTFAAMMCWIPGHSKSGNRTLPMLSLYL
jgi:hypothetical protein